MLKFLKRINDLKRTPRMGWLERGISLREAEDVAQHSFEVASISLMLTTQVQEKGEDIDLKKMLSLAIIHDWSEALTGDISHEISSQLGEEIKERVDKEAFEELIGGFPRPEEYKDLWREYSDEQTKESKLIHVADCLSVLVEIIGYSERGRRSEELDELWHSVFLKLKRHVDNFPFLEKLLDELEDSYLP